MQGILAAIESHNPHDHEVFSFSQKSDLQLPVTQPCLDFLLIGPCKTSVVGSEQSSHLTDVKHSFGVWSSGSWLILSQPQPLSWPLRPLCPGTLTINPACSSESTCAVLGIQGTKCNMLMLGCYKCHLRV